MLHARGAFDYISLVNHTDRLSPLLIIASAFGDQQNLTTWMNVPIQLCTGAINCLSNTGIEGTVSLNQFVSQMSPVWFLALESSPFGNIGAVVCACAWEMNKRLAAKAMT
jgi:hypothetical protein